jgi:hypothetical protein
MPDFNLFLETLNKMKVPYTTYKPEIFVNHKPAFDEVRVCSDQGGGKFGFFFGADGKYIGKVERNL